MTKQKLLKLRSEEPLSPVPHEDGKQRLRDLYTLIQNMPPMPTPRRKR